jgi:hypothetical protein
VAIVFGLSSLKIRPFRNIENGGVSLENKCSRDGVILMTDIKIAQAALTHYPLTNPQLTFLGKSQNTTYRMDEMKNVEEEAIALYSRLSTLHLQVARSQPIATPATLELLEQAILRTVARIPALERSIQEVKTEWNLS